MTDKGHAEEAIDGDDDSDVHEANFLGLFVRAGGVREAVANSLPIRVNITEVIVTVGVVFKGLNLGL